MKRIAIIAAAMAMFASTAAIALADEATESPDTDEETTEERVLSETHMWKVNILADYWLGGEEGEPSGDEEPESAAGDEAGTEPTIEDEIEALRTGDIVVGWGAMFKLMQLAKAYDKSLTEVAAMFRGEDEESGGWAFGRRFKELDRDKAELASPEGSPKNLGQLQKQARKADGTRGKKPKKP
jgi:hypothetical protein